MWQAWTPALTASTTNPTLGSGSSAVGRYVQNGTTVIGWAHIAFGSSGTNAGSGTYRVSLPVTPKTETVEHVIGSGFIWPGTGGAVPSTIFEIPASATYMHFRAGGIAIDHSGYGGNAWTTTGEIDVSFTYEAA